MSDSNLPARIASTLIIGGGPAGMACAWELVKAGRKNIVILERESQVGGLARTLQFDLPGVGAFRTDIGPHRFFSKNAYLYRLIEDVLGERWTLVDRFTRFHIGGRFYLYPPQIRNVMQGLGLWRCFKVIRDIGWERVKDIFRTRKIATFEDHVIHEFGRTLAEFNMINYTEKIWGLPCREISPNWAEQRIKGLGIGALIKSLLKKNAGHAEQPPPAVAGTSSAPVGTSSAPVGGSERKSGAKSLADRFYYPLGGAGVTYETIRDRIGGLGGCRVESGCHVTAVERGPDGRIATVVYDQAGVQKRIACEHLVSTMLLTDLVEALHPAAPPDILAARAKLRYRSQVYVFLMVDLPQVGPDNWVYFPDAQVPFARMYEPANFSRPMSPPGKSSLLLEHFCFADDPVWQRGENAPDAMVRDDIQWLVKLGFLRDSAQVLGWRIHRERNVYPIYDLTYQAPLADVLQYVESIPNLQCAGRGGRFRYTNQDHSREMGILAAQGILRGAKLAVENVGAEKEYFEAGYVPARSNTDPA